jgi:16S rRNA (cytidine1402-2'-O)-methyltransferase
MSGTLYLVATPIGNLEDITFRAVNVLKEVDIIACEDTRHTIKLCNHYNIKNKLVSYHEHNEVSMSESLIKELIDGKNVAIVSDAGTPAISDPGAVIVKQAIEQDINISPIPGPSAFVAALISSGLDTTKFTFFGFLSKRSKDRASQLESIAKFMTTVILYISPHSYKNDISDLYKYLGSRKIVVAREVTKIYETFLRGELGADIIQNYEPRGEICVVIEGSREEIKNEDNPLLEVSIGEHLEFYLNQGVSRNKAMRLVAKERKLSKNEVYDLILNEKKG